MRPMYLLTYDHGGYILWGEPFGEKLGEAAAWLDRYPSFKIGLDNEAFAYDAFADVAPQIIAQIARLLVAYPGRFGIGTATYGQPLSVFINEESNVRQLTYAIDTNLRHFGQTPPVYAMSEHAMHAQIPQLISLCGYDGAIMRTHFMMYGYNPTYPSAYGWWEGVDGTRVATVPTYDGQGAAFAKTTYDNWILTRWPDQTTRSLEKFRALFPDIEPLLASRLDDITLRCEALVAHVEGDPAYQWVLLEDIAGAYGEPQDVFAPGPDEFKVRMPWGYCGNRIWNLCREAEVAVLTAERASALRSLLGRPAPDAEARLTTVWKNLMVAQHHDVQICGLVREADEYAGGSLALSRAVLDESMAEFAGLFAHQTGTCVTVFNPLSWPVTTWVTTSVELPRGEGTRGFDAVGEPGRTPCEVRVTGMRRGLVTRADVGFLAQLPALSVSSYRLEASDEVAAGAMTYDAATGWLRGGGFEVRLTEGGIAEIRQDGAVLVRSEAGSLFRGEIDGEECVSSGRWLVTCASHSAEAVQVGSIGGIGYECTLTLREGVDRLDAAVRFLHHGETIGRAQDFGPDRFVENTNGFDHTGKLCFSLETVIREGTAVRDLPFAIAETAEDTVQGLYWTAVTDGTTGLAVLNRGAMGTVYDRRSGRIDVPLAYANAYIWGERYLRGAYEHRFSLLPFSGDVVGVHRRALEYEFPPVVRTARVQQAGEGVDGPLRPLDLTTDDNVIVSACYEQDSDVLLRCYECAGRDGWLRLPAGFTGTEVDLRGRARSDAAGTDFHLTKHQILTLRLIWV